jgi:hypothetical protein
VKVCKFNYDDLVDLGRVSTTMLGGSMVVGSGRGWFIVRDLVISTVNI